jgi:hypothetical protein
MGYSEYRRGDHGGMPSGNGAHQENAAQRSIDEYGRILVAGISHT